MGHPVLEHAQRADDGAVYSSEQQRDYQQDSDNHKVKGEHGGQELHFGHPRQKLVQRAGEIKEHQRDAEEKYGCEHPPDPL